MKKIKFLLTTALAFVAFGAFAQDLSGEAYAKWGETVEERRENMLRNSFLKEALNNKRYDEAADHFNYLVEKAPDAAVSIYQRGEQIYLRKMALAKSVAEQKEKFDSMLYVYDMRLKYFGKTPADRAEILDRRARQYVKYGNRDREGLRAALNEAIAADVEAGSEDLYETIVIYFSESVISDYKNDEVYPDFVLSEYGRLDPLFANIPAEKIDFKNQFDILFGTSGVASCENLEQLFAKKLAADPNNVDVLSQAVALMSRARCSSDFFFEIAERQYHLVPSVATAVVLAQGFKEKGEYDKASGYLREVMKNETEKESRINLLQELGLVELAASNTSAAMQVARELRELDEQNAYSYFITANCYASSGCVEAFWAAYDTMKKAEELFADEAMKASAQEAARAYAARWPLSNDEKFFMEGIKAGDTYTITCGAASGVRTTVRFR